MPVLSRWCYRVKILTNSLGMKLNMFFKSLKIEYLWKILMIKHSYIISYLFKDYLTAMQSAQSMTMRSMYILAVLEYRNNKDSLK